MWGMKRRTARGIWTTGLLLALVATSCGSGGSSSGTATPSVTASPSAVVSPTETSATSGAWLAYVLLEAEATREAPDWVPPGELSEALSEGHSWVAIRLSVRNEFGRVLDSLAFRRTLEDPTGLVAERVYSDASVGSPAISQSPLWPPGMRDRWDFVWDVPTANIANGLGTLTIDYPPPGDLPTNERKAWPNLAPVTIELSPTSGEEILERRLAPVNPVDVGSVIAVHEIVKTEGTNDQGSGDPVVEFRITSLDVLPPGGEHREGLRYWEADWWVLRASYSYANVTNHDVNFNGPGSGGCIAAIWETPDGDAKSACALVSQDHVARLAPGLSGEDDFLIPLAYAGQGQATKADRSPAAGETIYYFYPSGPLYEGGIIVYQGRTISPSSPLDWPALTFDVPALLHDAGWRG